MGKPKSGMNLFFLWDALTLCLPSENQTVSSNQFFYRFFLLGRTVEYLNVICVSGSEVLIRTNFVKQKRSEFLRWFAGETNANPFNWIIRFGCFVQPEIKSKNDNFSTTSPVKQRFWNPKLTDLKLLIASFALARFVIDWIKFNQVDSPAFVSA